MTMPKHFKLYLLSWVLSLIVSGGYGVLTYLIFNLLVMLDFREQLEGLQMVILILSVIFLTVFSIAIFKMLASWGRKSEKHLKDSFFFKIKKKKILYAFGLGTSVFVSYFAWNLSAIMIIPLFEIFHIQFSLITILVYVVIVVVVNVLFVLYLLRIYRSQKPHEQE